MKKLLSILLVILMILSSFLTFSVNAASVTDSSFASAIASLKIRYKDYGYWNAYNSCGYDGTGDIKCPSCSGKGMGYCDGSCPDSCGQFYYNGNWVSGQCMGFACKMGYEIFGSNPYSWEMHRNAADLRPGDIVYGNLSNIIGGASYHAIFITGVFGQNVTFADCNSIGPCQVKWDRTTTIQAIQVALNNSYTNGRFGYISHASNNNTSNNSSSVPLTTPTISFNKSSYTVGDTITVSWAASPSNSNLSHYWIQVTDPSGGTIADKGVGTSTSYSFTASSAGSYKVKVYATPTGSQSGEGSLTDTKSVTVNAKVTTYTVTYNANGGSGAPSSQVKTQNVALTLSSAVPTRSGYTFLGWSTSSTATSPTYYAGGSYTGNANLNLYAVWKKNVITGTTGDCTWTLDDTTLTISGNGVMGDYDYSNPSPWGESITDVVINDGVTSIGERAFFGCESLTSITIPDSVTSIGSWAFPGCTSLTSITISDSVTSIGIEAFYDTHYYNNSNNWVDNVLYIGNHLIKASDSISGSYIIKTGIITIADEAFYNCYSLTSITIPNSVTSIGNNAFSYCYNLTSITIPDSVTSIGYSAFENCTSLTSITIPDSVISIGGGAFWNCTSLTSITIPDSVTSIGSYAFCNCDSLTSITIPNSVTSIGFDAFSSCNILTNISIGGSVTSIGDDAFYGCTSLTSITIPDSVTSIGEYAFKNCPSLKSVYYRGSEEDKLNITIGDENECLADATWYYNSCIGSADHTYGDDLVCDECGHKNFVLGDIDGTGKVDLSDVTIIARYFAGWDTDCNEAALDVNGDGAVNLKDLIHLARYVAGWEGIVLR